MPITPEDLYQPISDFFLKKFATGSGAPVVFRFDKFGSLLSDQDFIDENHPDQGFNAALAREKFSELVNRVPLDAGDGVNVFLSQASIDDTYFFRLLSPALPVPPPGADPATQAAAADTFNAIKAKAVTLWDELTLQSLSGLMLSFKPSLATPENWYDTTSGQAWTAQTFNISASTGAPPAPVWRLRPLDTTLLQALKLPPTVKFTQDQVLRAVTQPGPVPDPVLQQAELQPTEFQQTTVQPVELQKTELQTAQVQTAELRPAQVQTPGFQTAELQKTEFQPAQLREAEIQPALIRETGLRETGLQETGLRQAGAATAGGTSNLHDLLLKNLSQVDLRNRILASQRLGELAPQALASTSSVSISFEYCLVSIDRPWWMDIFVSQDSWCLPGVPAGSLTAGSNPAGMSWLPVALLAVRNLRIDAAWSAEDAANAAAATDFGPFKVETVAGSQSLVHPGLQVVGWLMQHLPPLPPASAPQQ